MSDLTRQQLCAALGISESTVRRLELIGLPYTPISIRSKRYDLAEVKTWLTCSEEQFDQIYAEFMKLIVAENIRIEKEQADKKAEDERIAKVQADQEAKQKELDAKEAALKADQDKIDAEKKRIEDEETARLKKIADDKALEIAKKEAAEKAVKEAEEKRNKEEKAKAAQIEKDRIAAEKKAAKAPDKTKLSIYLTGIMQHMADNCPAIKDKEIYQILVDTEAVIEKTCDASIKKLEVL